MPLCLDFCVLKSKGLNYKMQAQKSETSRIIPYLDIWGLMRRLMNSYKKGDTVII